MGWGWGDAQRYKSVLAGRSKITEGQLLDEESVGTPRSGDDAGSWRYQRSGFAKVLALFGVVGGLACAILPGLIAARSYVRWQRDEIAIPTFAWCFAVLFGCGAALVGFVLLTSLVIPAVLLAFILVPALLILVTRS